MILCGDMVRETKVHIGLNLRDNEKYPGRKTRTRESVGLIMNGEVDFVTGHMEKAKVLGIFQELQADQPHLNPWEGDGANLP